MATPSFAADLELYGPKTASPKPVPPALARSYCQRLAKSHYENFTVASLLLPGELRQHFYNVYAYCRWADDMADEPADPQERMALLDWWEGQLHDCYRGTVVHPVFVALGETVREFQIPADPFVDLLVAFRQDQRVTRYDTPEAVLDYCRYSADPVGRIVLFLGGVNEPQNVLLADSICTGLQLTNFLQDVALDWDRGRIYLPMSRCRQAGYDEAMFARRECNEPFRHVMAAGVAEAEGCLRRGLPLVKLVPESLRLDVALFAFGGLAILDAIRRANYNVWNARPVLTKVEKLRILARCWWGLRKGTLLETQAGG
jgi:squalene synthase HpnC